MVSCFVLPAPGLRRGRIGEVSLRWANGLISLKRCVRTGSSTPYLSASFILTLGEEMSYKDRDTLFVFLDESGNLDFSATGTRYWSLTAFCTFHPSNGRHSFLDLFYTLADDNRGQEYFHAAEDRQEVRDEVFRLIGELADEYEIHCVIAEKRKTNPALYQKRKLKKGRTVTERDEAPFYSVVCGALLKYIFGCPRFQRATRIVIVLSSLFNREKHDAIRGALTVQLSHHTKAPFSIYFHQNKSDLNCQIADYCGWAIARRWELNDMRSYNLIGRKIRNEFDIFWRGRMVYF